MVKRIKTKKGIHEYKEVELYLGRKLIDREISKMNLLDFKKVMDNNNIKFGLIYGTLLGAIREQNFIEHDEDVDVFVLNEDRVKFLNTLFDLEKIGLKVVRYKKDLLSIMRDNDYIDIYFFRKIRNNKRRESDIILDAHYLESSESLEFLGERFTIPGRPKALLRFLYGDDWRIPQKDKKPDLNALDRKVKNYVKRKVPILHKWYMYFK